MKIQYHIILNIYYILHIYIIYISNIYVYKILLGNGNHGF